MDGDAEKEKPSTDPHSVVEQAQGMVAGQAGISLAEASTRISLYARFYDLQLLDACHKIINGTISLLHSGERRRQPPWSDPPD